MRELFLLFFVFNFLLNPVSNDFSKNDNHVNNNSSTITRKKSQSSNKRIGKVIDVLNGVNIYYNGPLSNVSGRNITADGYNLGLKYQCIEFVKRYYYEYYNHRMPDSYGHAKDIFDIKLSHGAFNPKRNLLQYYNGNDNQPQVGDIFVFKGSSGNPFGHIGIVSMVGPDRIEMVQQNVRDHTRNLYRMINKDGNYTVEEKDLIGWMRRS